MRRDLRSALVSVGLVGAGMVGGLLVRAQAPAPPVQPPADTAAMRANYDRWRSEFKTWNRWGADDNKGTSNLNIVENLDLERAVQQARRTRQYEFLVTFAPLPVEGGTGSPVNPLAIF